MILALKSAFVTSQTLGNDSGARLPGVASLVSFCLAGLGASLDATQLEAAAAALRMPDRIAPGGR